ncbi:MAG: hypothetical protein IT522_01945, partial [Burkholderiales bacterium]|nr:hypothetical protein [Burkholderiales bacterium]
TRAVVAAAVVDALASLDLDYPTIDATQRAELVAAKAILEGENGKARRAGTAPAASGKKRPHPKAKHDR